MATLRMRRRRFEQNWVALLLAGIICGAALAGAIIALRQGNTRAVVPLTVAPPAQVSQTAGGRLGGITSADTPNDAAVKQGLAADESFGAGALGANGARPGTDIVGGDQTFRPNEPLVGEQAATGGRLGGVQSADTPNDAAVKAQATAEPSFGPFVMPNVDRFGADDMTGAPAGDQGQDLGLPPSNDNPVYPENLR